jgi:hypothetical protein
VECVERVFCKDLYEKVIDSEMSAAKAAAKPGFWKKILQITSNVHLAAKKL